MVARKVILDVDPGIDDAVALCMALFQPSLEVVATTAVAGNVDADQVTTNLTTVIEQLDPPRWPRIGAATKPDVPLPADSRNLFGKDGLGEAGFPVVELANRHPSVKVICDELNSAANDVAVVCLGPLTNIARSFQRDPQLQNRLDQLVIMGGTLAGPGNVTAAAEFNFYCDPASAQAVLQLPVTKTIIPLDVASQVEFRFDFLDQLPSEETRVGRFLQRILPFTFRAHRQFLGKEAIFLHDAVALVLLTNPELFEVEPFPCDVELRGTLTTGALVVDRRKNSPARPNAHVAVSVDAAGVLDCIVRSLTSAAQR